MLAAKLIMGLLADLEEGKDQPALQVSDAAQHIFRQ